MSKKHQTELYMVRHAETVMNTTPHLVGGRSNHTQLTAPVGVQQSERLGNQLFLKNFVPDRVFSSPAVRTIETARLSLAKMSFRGELILDDDLQELSQGIWEGRSRIETYTEEVLRDIEAQGKAFKLEGGESMNDVGVRMYSWASRRFPSDSPSEQVLVYTHGGAIKCLASHLLNWSRPQTFETEIDNTSVSLFIGNGEDWRVAYLNRDVSEI